MPVTIMILTPAWRYQNSLSVNGLHFNQISKAQLFVGGSISHFKLLSSVRLLAVFSGF